MRKRFLALLTGALVLVLSAGVGLSVAGTTESGADPASFAGTDNLSHPLGEKQEALKQVALQKVAKGEIPKGTKVGKVAKGQYVELAREGEDSILTILGEFGNSINPVTGGTPGPLHNQIPQPDRSTDNITIWAPDFTQAYYDRPALRRPRGRELDAELLQGAVVEPVHGQRRSHQLGPGAVQRGALRHEPVRKQRLLDRVGIRELLGRCLGRDDVHGRPQREAREVRRLGSVRLRRRRQLQRARRLYRPLPVDPRRRRRGDGWRRPGRERDLVAPVVRVLLRERPGWDRPARLRRCADRRFELLDRRLHDRAGERRRRRVLARVRARPRAAGRVRHVGQHGRRRERHGLLDADVPGLVRQQRHPGGGHRRPAVPHERLGQAPARLAGLHGRRAWGQADVVEARPVRGDDEAGSGRDRRAPGEARRLRLRRSGRRLEVLLLRLG